MKLSSKGKTLIVDYGTNRVEMPYRVSLENFYTKELLDMEHWCTATFKPYTWHKAFTFPGYMYFVKQSDATMFQLRWIK
jgi:hypothetical protein